MTLDKKNMYRYFWNICESSCTQVGHESLLVVQEWMAGFFRRTYVEIEPNRNLAVEYMCKNKSVMIYPYLCMLKCRALMTGYDSYFNFLFSYNSELLEHLN